jgi:hypothetical protein
MQEMKGQDKKQHKIGKTKNYAREDKTRTRPKRIQRPSTRSRPRLMPTQHSTAPRNTRKPYKKKIRVDNRREDQRRQHNLTTQHTNTTPMQDIRILQENSSFLALCIISLS